MSELPWLLQLDQDPRPLRRFGRPSPEQVVTLAGHGVVRRELPGSEDLPRRRSDGSTWWLAISRDADALLPRVAAMRSAGGSGGRAVLCLRSTSELLAAQWTRELLHDGAPADYWEWLEHRLGGRGASVVEALADFDPAETVEAWANALGPDRLTVVASDSPTDEAARPVIEKSLGLPDGMLGGCTSAREGIAERGLTRAEVSLVHGLQAELEQHQLGRVEFDWLVRRGAIPQLLTRRPGPREPMPELPSWLVDALDALRESSLRRIMDCGVELVGSLPQPPAASAEPDPELPIGIAVEAMYGLVGASTGRGPGFVRTSESVRRKLSVDLTRNYPRLAWTLVRRSRRAADPGRTGD